VRSLSSFKSEKYIQHSVSFHLDHAAALSYVTEKVCEGVLADVRNASIHIDKFQRRKRQSLHDTSNESASQVYDAGLCADEVCYK
jgi:hypothetical protein